MAVATETFAVPLVVRKFCGPDGNTVRSTYRCSACCLDLADGEVVSHMAAAHGFDLQGWSPTPLSAGAPSAAPDPAAAEGSPTAGKRWRVERRIYTAHQPDGSTAQRIAYACPLCEEEFGTLDGVSEHMRKAHGVLLSTCKEEEEAAPERAAPESEAEVVGERVQVQRLRLPNGELRLVCPICREQFSKDTTLLEHVARTHGAAWQTPGDGDKGRVPAGESDHLDMLHQACSEAWLPRREEVLDNFHVVSLGSFCGVKFSIQRLGLGEAHLPFDWVRTTSAGICHFVRAGFDGFFEYASQIDVPGTRMRVFRSQMHSFWHDHVDRPEARAKLQRRIDRFLALRDDPKSLLFVRSVTSTDELCSVEAMYAALVERFGESNPGRRVLLAVVVDGQPGFTGPVQHQCLPGVVFYLQDTHEDPAGRESDTFVRAIASAAEAALDALSTGGDTQGFGPLQSELSTPSAAALLNAGEAPLGPLQPCYSGLKSGYEGVDCFEPLPTPSPRAPSSNAGDAADVASAAAVGA